MKAFIIENEGVLAPFGEVIRFCQIGNRLLHQRQREVLREVGLEPFLVRDREGISAPSSEEHLVVDGNLCFSAELVREFVSRSMPTKAATVCALKNGEFTHRTEAKLQNVKISDQAVEYGLCYFPESQRDGVQQTIVIDPDELHASIPMPPHMCGRDHYSIPVTDKFIIAINHWVHLWWANLVTTFYPGARLERSGLARQLWLAVKARSFNRWQIARQINQLGSGCDIHPTAYVENSIIGNDVTLNAGAIVRNAIIGDRVSIGNGVVIEESVIGHRCIIMNGRVLFSVLGDDTFSLAEVVTASLMGNGCFLGLNSTMTDFRLDDRNVKVEHEGRIVSSDQRFLGACLGHNCYLGSGCVVSPGRIIPNDTRLALAADRVVGQINIASDPDGYRSVKPAG